MTFRFARHTSDLNRIEKFYTEIVGLEKLGSFENHDNYNGLFLGHPHLNWHLEFTASATMPMSKYDEDDLIVFYVHTKIELDRIKAKLKQKSIPLVIPKNPYWIKNGLMICDPDNYRVVFSIKQLPLNSDDELTNLIKDSDIESWSDLIEFTKKIPYGRNLNRADFSLVLKEHKGTCSSKHSFLKKVAQLNNIDHVKLILGIYKMNHSNTPKIGNTLVENGLEYIPEAHCYLKINGKRIDITNSDSDIENFAKNLLEEFEIEPEQVVRFKIDYHQSFLKSWIIKNNTHLNFERIWEIREQCIKSLEQ
jgi:hypothetical protein